MGTRAVGVWDLGAPLCNPFGCSWPARSHCSVSRAMSDSSSTAGDFTARVASFPKAEDLMLVEKLHYHRIAVSRDCIQDGLGQRDHDGLFLTRPLSGRQMSPAEKPLLRTVSRCAECL